MDQNLRDASEQGNVDGLYSSIARDPKVLDKIDEIPFVDTPLHVAAAAGQTQLAMEMMMLKPSFARNLNPNGFTPLLLAMHTNRIRLVLKLLKNHKDLVCAQGRGGMNPLHYAAQTGNLALLVEILRVYPKSIEVVTSQSETALHVAVKNNMLDAFQLLVGWLRRAWFKNAGYWENWMLTRRDVDGNTVLHIAASKNQLQVVRWLLPCRNFFDINAKNSEGLTALDMVDNQEMRNILCCAQAKSASSLPTFASWADYFRSPIKIKEMLFVYLFRQRMRMSNDMRNMLLVVAVLLVTIAYQAVLSPPGGFWQDNYIPGTNNQFNITATTNATNEVNQVPHWVGTMISRDKIPECTGNQILSLPINTGHVIKAKFKSFVRWSNRACWACHVILQKTVPEQFGAVCGNFDFHQFSTNPKW
ncbi:ankyrin repeat-containing protein BDA1-like [Corylus avellana]|uniref:ankyrin repeat-containing protein BDA1-like n=1 Tax=Corylus avellana TaxID=13451 RepID=UPI00286CB243|nr:ankyrin repeat-containing protein BDA1-like [Corylus avellana]